MDCLSIVLWSLISFVSLIYIYFKKKYSHWKNRGVNYVEPTFPLGNLSFGKTHFKDFSTKIYKQKNEDPFVGAYILAKPIAIATSLDFIQNVLVKDFSNFHERGGYSNEVDDPLSANMLTLDGERWKFLRTKLSPTFTSGKMKLMFSTVVEVANRFSDTLADIVKPEAEVELRDLLARFTTDVIGSCAFGVECNSLKDPNAVFRYYGSKVFEDSAIGPLTHLLAVQYPKLARKLHIRLSRKDVSDFFLKTVRETIDYREKNNVKRNDFMNYLIQLKNGESIDGKDSTERKKLTIEEVTAQAFLFFGAGFETSSTTMTYCLYELALNPDIQERARQEINDVLEKHEDKFTYEALQEMTYVEQIISEALRKYPPIVLLQRKAAQDYQIPNTKIILEKGQEVIIPVYCVHHDPEIYPNPEMFDPSRFAPEQKYSYWKDRGVNYVEPTFPLGNISLRKEHFRDFLINIYKHKNEDPFVGAYVLAKPVVLPTSLDFIQSILVKDFSIFHERGTYWNEEDDPLSAHMFSVEGEKWKSLRTKLSPTFTSGKMKFMFPAVIEVAHRFNATLADIVKPGTELEIRDFLARFTTDVIGSCAFGIECNSLKDPNSAFRYYGKKIFEDPPLGPALLLLAIQYPDLARKLHVRQMRKEVSDFFLNTVRETIDYREKNNVKRNDFMNFLIQLKNGESIDDESASQTSKLTLEEVAAQAFLFFAAGFETSSTTMTYSLYELALNPDIQDKARQEIKDVLTKHEGQLTYEAVQEMTYIDQIISEALRKYPPVVFLTRRATRDYRIPNTKIIIEKGQDIIIPAYCIHHDPEIYSNPEVFDPNRFTPEEIKSRHPVSFLGFGDGPRNCVGLRFGRMQARIGLVTLLSNYRFKPSPKTAVPLTFDVDIGILTPKGGMYLGVEKI
ncbi:unnamed protein product [Hermetia illucens]|uniref:Cytochrome P450 n=1 Tax=Hermetia illucens TaxID=343691 RepID=A0A7R8YRH3_HERIL|nr:unnamed protein product [Hermetia illucens]